MPLTIHAEEPTSTITTARMCGASAEWEEEESPSLVNFLIGCIAAVAISMSIIAVVVMAVGGMG
jgi:hypothetical protein